MAFTGYIKLYRQLADWQWYGDAVVKSVFIHLLLTANYKEAKWNGITLQPGQVVTSIRKLSDDLRHTQRQTRTALDRLKSTHEITIKPTSKYSVITVVNWAKFQSDGDGSDILNNTQNDKQTTHKAVKNDTQNDNSKRNIRNNKELKELFNSAKPSYDMEEFERRAENLPVYRRPEHGVR